MSLKSVIQLLHYISEIQKVNLEKRVHIELFSDFLKKKLLEIVSLWKTLFYFIFFYGRL